MNFTSNRLVNDDTIIRKRKLNNAQASYNIRKKIQAAFTSNLAFTSVSNKRFFIKLIVTEYFSSYRNITEEQITFILVEYLNKYSKFNTNKESGLKQIILDIGLILKVENGIKKVETLYSEIDEIDFYTMDSEYDELFQEGFSNSCFKYN